MQYLYQLANASLTLRLVEYLTNCSYIPSNVVTVISQIDGWVVKVKFKSSLSSQQDKNIKAVLNELGIVYFPSKLINLVLMELENGGTITNVMCRYPVAIVSHGVPQSHEIEIFRQHFIDGLGYCPQYLA